MFKSVFLEKLFDWVGKLLSPLALILAAFAVAVIIFLALVGTFSEMLEDAEERKEDLAIDDYVYHADRLAEVNKFLKPKDGEL